MKTILLSAALILAASWSSYGQSRSNPSSLHKGSVLLGASGTGNFSSSRLGTSKSFLAAPWAGYLVHDRLVTGLSVHLSQERFTSRDTDMLPDQEYDNVSPELFARYYLMSGKLRPFAQLGTGYNFISHPQGKTRSPYLSPSAGLSYWLGDRVALEASYTLKLQNEVTKQADPASDLKFRIGLSVGIR